jgi:gamma-glutamyltranspeptidase/glutathione hydrolase/leukotriene-C4 hydrolase
MIKLSGNLTAYSVPAPGAGPVIALMLNVLDDFIPAADIVTTHHRIIEAMKWAYGQRTRMGDPHFVDIEDVSYYINKNKTQP